MTAPTLTPVYTDVAAEYRAITEAAGLHDSSDTGRLKATGADALDLINRLSTNGIVNLAPRQWAPTILTTDRGRILDLLGVVNTGDYVLLLTSPGCQQTVIDWLDRYTIMEDLTVADITNETALLTVAGPESAAALGRVAVIDREDREDREDTADREDAADAALADLGPYAIRSAAVAGRDALVIRRPLGAMPAFDLMVDAAAAPEVWDALEAAGIPAVGQQAFEAALVQHGIPRHGRELGDAYNPLEAGLIGSVDFAKGCYIGQEVIARLDTYQKVQRYLVRLRFSEAAQVSEDAGLELDGRSVGRVTSLAANPATGELAGLGYVRTARANPGQTLTLAAPSTGTAEVTDLPLLFGPGE